MAFYQPRSPSTCYSILVRSRVQSSQKKRKSRPPPLPQGGSMKVLVPRPGSGLPCPPVPNVVLPLLTCSRPPYLRRSGRRSCCSGEDPDGDATVVAKKSPAAFLGFWPPALLPIILTVCRCFNKYHPTSTGRHPPGPPASNKWPIWALGSPGPKYRASPWAPRAALPQAKGRPWPVSPDGRQRALRSPLPAQSRALPSP